MKQLALLFALGLAAFHVSAETPETSAFYGAAQSAGFMCALKSNTLQTAIAYSSPKTDKYATEVLDCISEKDKAIEDAYKAIPNTPDNSDIRANAKAVYSAWLTYSQRLVGGLSYEETDHGVEAAAFNHALSDYWTELKLSP